MVVWGGVRVYAVAPEGEVCGEGGEGGEVEGGGEVDYVDWGHCGIVLVLRWVGVCVVWCSVGKGIGSAVVLYGCRCGRSVMVWYGIV